MGFLRSYFPLLILGWIITVGGLWVYGNSEIAAALLGTGPFALYYVYEEGVKRPIIQSDGEIKYRKKIGRSRHGTNKPQPLAPVDMIYPVIEAYTVIENVGKEPAKDVSVDIELDTGDEFTGRWDIGRPVDQLDIHPNTKEELLIMRIVPTLDTLYDVISPLDNVVPASQYKEAYREARRAAHTLDEDQGTLPSIPEEETDDTDGDSIEIPEPPVDIDDGYVLAENYRSISFDEPRYEPIGISGCEVHIQVPYSLRHEEAIMAQQELDVTRVHWFIGKYIEPRYSYGLNAKVSCPNLTCELDLNCIEVETALSEGRYEYTNPKYNEFITELDSYGWNNLIS